jgi:hypothetical protein
MEQQVLVDVTPILHIIRPIRPQIKPYHFAIPVSIHESRETNHLY